MFKGDYNFFEYKYNIIGYNGQDYGSFPQYLYLIISAVLLFFLLFILRKLPKEKVLKTIRIIGVFLTLLYIGKTIWESIYDIKLSGGFNTGLLPFDTCSIIMYAAIISGFARGKIKELSDAWIATGGVVGGIATMVTLNAFKFYPFLSFGAFYSMLWHFLMVFLGLLLIITKYVPIKYKTIINGFLFHLMISLFVIPIDYIFNFDFMLYKNLGGVPVFENIASNLTALNLSFFNPIIMIILYFITFNIIFLIPILINNIKNKKGV